MLPKDHKTAILFFTRSAKQEACAKSFSIESKKSRELSKVLIQRTRALLQQSDFPVFEIGTAANELVAVGFVRALESLWSKGFDRIISVGNDCPQLTGSDLKEASTLLDTHELVAGPDLRGGVYLLGITKKAYDRQLFLGFPWHTHRFLDYVKSLANDPGLLNPLADVNHIQDIHKLAFSPRKNLARFIINLFQGQEQPIPQPERRSFSSFPRSSPHRGPPAFSTPSHF